MPRRARITLANTCTILFNEVIIGALVSMLTTTIFDISAGSMG